MSEAPAPPPADIHLQKWKERPGLGGRLSCVVTGLYSTGCIALGTVALRHCSNGHLCFIVQRPKKSGNDKFVRSMIKN